MAGMYDQNTVFQVQQANDIIDVVSEHVNLKRKGREMVGLCPFHDDHSPSMNVSPAKQIFKCFACGAGGDVFKFVQMRENLTFPQAIERLAERARIELKPRTPRRAPASQNGEEGPPQVDPNRLAKLNAWAAEHFSRNLNDPEKGKYARDYLAQRKISPESAKKWRVGLALDSRDDLLKAARAKKIPTTLLEQGGLITANNQDKFVNRLMFTISDVTGRIIAFGGRTLADAPAKYMNSPTTVLFDKSNCLYGIEQARHKIVSSGLAVIVEGYTDVMMAHQFDCTNVVATLGTSLTAGHGRMIRRYAKEVVLVFDSDVAGIEAANRALEVCLSQRIDIKLASVPEGKDPCDFLLAAGKDAFEKLLGEAVGVLQFKWDRLKERFASETTSAARRAAIEEYLQAIAVGLSAGNVSPIETGIMVNRISSIIGLDKRQINDELNIRLRRASRNAGYNVENQKVFSADLGSGLFAAAQRELLEILLHESRFFKTVEGKVKPEDFDVPLLREIARIVFDLFETRTDVSLQEILGLAESVELANAITDLSGTSQEKGKADSRLSAVLDIFARHIGRRDAPQVTAQENAEQFLKQAYENAAKKNRHNIGMT